MFSYDALRKADRCAYSFSDREHVTKFMVNHPEIFELINIRQNVDWSHERWTVDTKEDFILVKNILETLYPVKKHFSMEDVMKLLNSYPTWRNINSHIKQKKE